MALLTTGLIDNTAVSGVRPSSTLTVLVSNDDSANETVLIEGFYQSGTTKIMYVQELFNLAPGEVAQRNYYAEFDAFEFQFTVSSQFVVISAWGKDAAGNLTTAHRIVAEEVDLVQ
ncbi:hypothetical protein REC12_03625 [Desulfosporosinus sp. PR]|uniref:hypothetical protein n=1 Tax=Candidatus Desulfosporosinus nitrosoreducens TaxID=3401928 RepID=UPI0027F92980|nr:hypothetical protein [Desulfosporosinus sp. PR]MDQ7092669.1 hypothetical protein [Desulfosporosinus sp. PR]